MVDEFKPEIETWFWEERKKAANNNQDAVVIFELPKPLSAFWFKGEEYEKTKNPDKIEGTPWGIIYRQSMPAIWESIGFFSSEAPKGFHIYRLNNFGDHKSGKYYYIWHIYQKN